MEKIEPQIVKRFLRLVKPFFFSEKKWVAFGLLFLIALLSLSSRGIDVLINYISGDFINAIQLREKTQYFHHLYRYLGVFLIATPVLILYGFVEQRLGLIWWQWLSQYVLTKYFGENSFYKISNDPRIDNSDQRIAEDIKTFTSTSLSFFLIIFNSILTFFAFIGILWTISKQLAFASLICAVISSFVTYILGRPLIKYNFLQRKKEADYRYKLVNVRDNAESIAFLRGGQYEYRRTRQRLRKAGENLKNIIAWSRNLGFFTQGYNYSLGIIPIMIVAPLYFDQKIEFGKITQAGLAFGQVLGSLNIIVSNFGNLSTLLAVTTRLGVFVEVLNENRVSDGGITYKEGEKLEFVDLTVTSPASAVPLIRSLNLKIEQGASILIVGPSGSGKSSLLRSISGLWDHGSGVVIKPHENKIFFIPQRPYSVIGSLRNQLLYATKKLYSDTELIEVIKKVKLEKMYERVGSLDAVLDWHNLLSTGEQQKIAFARLFLAKPEIVFLDEATTALNHRDEDLFYRYLKETNTTIISVGHRTNLSKYHNQLLEINGGGGSYTGSWKIDKIEGEKKY